MAAPATTARQTPTGFKMPDGFKTTIAFANKPAVNLWERGVKPPGLDGGEPIETTTMHNTSWRTKDARSLKTLDMATFKAGWDPDVYTDLLTLVNIPQAITIHFPDNSTLAFYGYLQKFVPEDLEEGKFPEAECTIACTNWDPVNHVEAAPVFTAAVGT